VNRFEVIESRVHVHADGRTASIYGAHPGPGFAVKSRGFVVRDNKNGIVGQGKRPYATQAEAQAAAERLSALHNHR